MDRIQDSPEPYYRPSSREVDESLFTHFRDYVSSTVDLKFGDYQQFELYAVEHFECFWKQLFFWSKLPYEGSSEPVCTSRKCDQAEFFPHVRLNYAECLVEGLQSDAVVITAHRLDGGHRNITGAELRDNVKCLSLELLAAGVMCGDVVVAVARNGVEVAIAALASAAVGATFASCSVEMTAHSILRRIEQLHPKALIAHTKDAAWDAGDRASEKVLMLVQSLASLRVFVALDGPRIAFSGLSYIRSICLSEVIGDVDAREFVWRRFGFSHPLFVLFSSGTTGPPKGIVHGAGGTLLEHCKEHRLHCDLRKGDKMLFQTSCAWMMWNWQLSALASGVQLLLFDGVVSDPAVLWRLVANERVTTFGTSSAFLQFCENKGYSPCETCDFGSLKSILSTGSILYNHQFDWVARHVKSLALQSISGGTDIIGCFVLGSPVLPVYRGEAQCRSLGLDVRALCTDASLGGVGELVCANPFPSRPVGFWSDPNGARFRAAYFSQNADYWTHGDLIEFTSHGGARLHGRTDGVLNLGGVRVGPADIYAILSGVPEVTQALAVAKSDLHVPGGAQLVLLLVLRRGSTLDSALVTRIRRILLQKGSTSMVPHFIVDVSDLPRTHSGKLSESAASAVVNGSVPKNLEALGNPDCLAEIGRRAAKL